MTTNEAALVLLSTVVGGGIVGLPFAIFHLGLPLGFLFCILSAYIAKRSASLYILLREKTPPGNLESLYEIGFMCSGRKAIFMISASVTFFCLGLVTIYFIVIGDIFSILLSDLVP